eukprot:gnl/TRDRNA2_/TRDRNA2_130553_c1_seq1.p1 gnl/TRDRNA2_/TRDRNA2_130553_c1~~gnl/TRDRNA2_/TRDRNA2_130553_c1_seq1.p1  ORF type:complete len:690 (+),score=95.12 gnl/TRDRNA2_/TRDRNA2_130553_c1_seq1:82-2151(+)
MAVAGVPAEPPPPWASSRTRRSRRGQRREVDDDSTLAVSLTSASDGSREAARFGGGRPTFPKSAPDGDQVLRMLHEFKTTSCVPEGSMPSHDHRCCPYFHSERDRRRKVLGVGNTLSYCAEPCEEQFDDHRLCYRGDSCGLCHSTAELLYHPDFFRKRLCHQAKRCPRGRFCAFAHSRQELLVPHFREIEEREPTEEFIAYQFKTQWCPIGGPHDWENCVYAHTYRDWRRMPILGYSSRPCPQWKQSVERGPPELSYEQRCPRGMACPMAHGAKEQLYHPQFYKTSPCSEASCKRGPLCAFTHGELDIDRPWAREPAVPSRSLREEIPNAIIFLDRNQPTYWNPPRYHALEDPTRFGSSSSKGGKAARIQRGFNYSDKPQHGKGSTWMGLEVQSSSSSGDMATASTLDNQKLVEPRFFGQDTMHRCATEELPRLPPVPESPAAVCEPGLLHTTPMPACDPSTPSGYMMPQNLEYFCPSQQMCYYDPACHGQLGYPMQTMDPSAMQLGYGSYGPMVWNGGAVLCVPTDHMQMQQAYKLDGSPTEAAVTWAGPMDSNQAPSSGSKAHADHSRTSSHHGHHFSEGLRTPSSYNASPPLSGTPTEAPTPRQPAESTHTSGHSSTDPGDVDCSASDGTTRESQGLPAGRLSKQNAALLEVLYYQGGSYSAPVQGWPSGSSSSQQFSQIFASLPT